MPVIETKFLDCGDRPGFFTVSSKFPGYTPSPKQTVFVLALSGDKEADALCVLSLKALASGLGPEDSFSVIYPARAFPSGSPYESLNATGNEVVFRKWVYSDTFLSENHGGSSVIGIIDSINVVPFGHPGRLTELITNAIRMSDDNDKPVTEIITLFASGGEVMEEAISLPQELTRFFTPGILFDSEVIARTAASANRYPRLSFVKCGVAPWAERFMRQLAMQTNGFFIDATKDNPQTYVDLFRYDFLREVRLTISGEDASFLHDNRYLAGRDPLTITVSGRTSRFRGLSASAEHIRKGVLKRVRLRKPATQDTSIAGVWAGLRAFNIGEHIHAYGSDDYLSTELEYLQREWGVDVIDIPKHDLIDLVPTTTNISGRSKSNGGGRTKNIADRISTITSFAEIVPDDSMYARFPRVSSMFTLIDAAQALAERDPVAIATGLSIRGFEEKIKLQLGLDYSRRYAGMYDSGVGEVALVSDDPLNPWNPQITIIFEMKKPLLSRMRLAEYRSRLRSSQGTFKTRKFEHHGRKVTALESDDGVISSYSTYLDDVRINGNKIALTTNSMKSLDRILDVVEGKLNPLSSDPAYIEAEKEISRNGNERGGESTFFCISSAFQRSFDSDNSRLIISERLRTRKKLRELNTALQIFRREYPYEKEISLEILVEKKFLPDGFLKDKNEYRYDSKSGEFISVLFGRLDYMRFYHELNDAELRSFTSKPKDGMLKLPGIVPVGIRLIADEGIIHFETIILSTPSGNTYKYLREILATEGSTPSENDLAWSGYLLSLRTEALEPKRIGLMSPKEQIILQAALSQLRKKLRTAVNWQSRKDILGWVGSEIVLGFTEIRTGLEDFLYNSKGFALIEVKDYALAEEFLEALGRSLLKRGGETSKSSHDIESESGIKIMALDNFFYAAFTGDWLLISNDREVFSEMSLRIPNISKGTSNGRGNLSLRLITGGDDIAGRMRRMLLIESGRRNASRLDFIYGSRFNLYNRNRTSGSQSPPIPGHVHFLDESTGLITSPFFGAASSGRGLEPQPFPILCLGASDLSMSGKFERNRMRLSGSMTYDFTDKRSASLSVPRNLESLTQRLRTTQRADALVEAIEERMPWLAGLAEARLSTLGGRAMESLMRAYSDGYGKTRVAVLRAMRRFEMRTVSRYLNRLYRTAHSVSGEVKTELYRTLVHFGHDEAIVDIYSAMTAGAVKDWHFEVIRDEKIEALVPALIDYIICGDNAFSAGRLFRHWLSGQMVGGRTIPSLCMEAISAIGKPAIPLLLKKADSCSENQRAMIAVTILNMTDILIDDLMKIKGMYGSGANEIIDAVIKALEKS